MNKVHCNHTNAAAKRFRAKPISIKNYNFSHIEKKIIYLIRKYLKVKYQYAKDGTISKFLNQVAKYVYQKRVYLKKTIQMF